MAALDAPRVLVTAEEALSRKLASQLREAGFAPDVIPCLQIETTPHVASLADELGRPADWLVLTSRNGVHAFLEAVHFADIKPDRFAPAIATVGPATAGVLRKKGFAVTLTPPTATAAALVRSLSEQPAGDVLVLQGNLAEPTIPSSLTESGFSVRALTVYRTIEAPADEDALKQALEAPPAAVTLLSPSAARVVARTGGELFRRQRLVCIGPVTADEVRRLGGEPAGIARPHTVPGVVEAVINLVREGASQQPQGMQDE